MMPSKYKNSWPGSKARNLTRSRNLQNLHSVTIHEVLPSVETPTASTVSKRKRARKKNYFIPNSTPLQHNLPPSLISPPIVPILPKQKKTFQQPSFYQNMNTYRKQSRRRRKRANRWNANNSWFNPNLYPPENKNETDFATDTPEESYFEEVEVASDDNENQEEIPVGFRKSKIQYLRYKKQHFFKPKIYRFGQQRTIVNCLNLQKENTVSPDVDIVSEAEYEVDILENEKLDTVDIENEKADKVDSPDNLDGVEDDDDCQIIFVKTNINISENKEDFKTLNRIYQTCIEDSPDLLQGKSLIQNSLDSWKAHLIGLQYLIEIQNASKDSVLKYHCVLCSEDFSVEGFPAVMVINHINGYKHVVKYLEKHFPACGYSYDENGSFDNNVVIIQKLCEEINRIDGYYFMCVTSIDQFEKSKDKMQELISNATQSTEDSVKIDINLLQKTFETIVTNEISDVLNNILNKIAPAENTAKKLEAESCNKAKSAKNKLKCPSVRPKRSSAVSSYLKLKNAFNMPQNVKSSVVSKEVAQEKILMANTGEVSGAKTKILKKNYANIKASPQKVKKTVIQVVSKPPPKAVSKVSSNMVIKNASKMFSKAPSKVVSKVLSKAISKARSKVMSNVPVKAVSRVVQSISSPKADLQSKEKAVLTSNIHSKHCLKRILGKENSSLIEEHAAGVSLKPSVKHQSGDHINSSSASVSVMPEKKKIVKSVELKRGSKASSSHKKRSPFRKVTSVQTVSGVSSVSPIKSQSKSPYRIVNYKDVKDSSQEVRAVIRNTHKKIVTRTESPRRRSRSPFKRTVKRQSKSPLRPTITSPIRVSPLRRRSRTPVRRRQRTPVRRDSRSPVRRHSRSPVKAFSRSPVRRRSRSPIKRYLRSPIRRHSRSPFRRQSRSPVKRHSRSPFRRVSRSPSRRHSRSPYRKYSRSPLRRHSRSPHRRHSRSPLRRSRSPHKRHSRSPLRYHSKSPLRRHSRSPRRNSRSPVSLFKSTFRGLSPNFEHRIIKDHKSSPGLFSSSNKMPFDMNLDMKKLLGYKDKHASKRISPNRSNPSKMFMHSRSFASDSGREIDLDPVSDEDESVYFNTVDKQQHTDRQMSPSKMMLAQFFRKFSMPDESSNDTTMKKFMQFMQAHSEELKELMGSQFDPKSSNMPSANVDTNAQDRNLLLKQYLLQNLAGNFTNFQGSVTPNIPFSPSVPNMPPPFIQPQPPFMHNQPPLSFGHVPRMPTQNVPPSTHNPDKIFPPNLSMPPPERFPQFNQPHQSFPSKPQVPPEVMFKDLKATVSKLFGANASGGKQDKNKNVPVFVNEPESEMWDLNRPDSRKFTSPPGQKNMFVSPGKKSNFHGIPGISVREEIPPSYEGGPGQQFFNNRGNIEQTRAPSLSIPPPDAKVSFCDAPAGSSKGNLFPVVNNSARMSSNRNSANTQASHDVKVSLASRLASVLVKVGMIDVPAPLLQEMLMKIGAFSSSPPQDITEAEIVSILKRLGYLS